MAFSIAPSRATSTLLLDGRRGAAAAWQGRLREPPAAAWRGAHAVLLMGRDEHDAGRRAGRPASAVYRAHLEAAAVV